MSCTRWRVSFFTIFDACFSFLFSLFRTQRSGVWFSDSFKQFLKTILFSLSALEVLLNDTRYTNPRFTYLLIRPPVTVVREDL